MVCGWVMVHSMESTRVCVVLSCSLVHVDHHTYTHTHATLSYTRTHVTSTTHSLEEDGDDDDFAEIELVASAQRAANLKEGITAPALPAPAPPAEEVPSTTEVGRCCRCCAFTV